MWAPWWVLSLYTGPAFGLLLGLYSALTGADALTAGVTGVLGALLFGLVMGPLAARLNRRSRPVVEAIPPGHEREVVRAAARGPAPADPQLRAAALRLATHQLEGALRFRWPVTAGLVLFTLAEAAAALAYTPWLWIGAATFLAILVLQISQPGRLRRRIAELSGE